MAPEKVLSSVTTTKNVCICALWWDCRPCQRGGAGPTVPRSKDPESGVWVVQPNEARAPAARSCNISEPSQGGLKTSSAAMSGRSHQAAHGEQPDGGLGYHRQGKVVESVEVGKGRGRGVHRDDSADFDPSSASRRLQGVQPDERKILIPRHQGGRMQVNDGVELVPEHHFQPS